MKAAVTIFKQISLIMKIISKKKKIPYEINLILKNILIINLQEYLLEKDNR